MKTRMDWYDRYLLSISEYLTIKDISNLCNISLNDASKIYHLAIKYCVDNDLELLHNKVPTESVLRVTGKDINYYFQKLEQETNAIKMRLDEQYASI